MRYDQISPVPPLTKVTKNVIILCVVVYFFDLITDSLGIRFGYYRLNELFGLVPAFVLEKGWAWQFVTYIFMHGHMLHLLMNMLILWYFGAEIEMRLGELNFLKYFLLCGVGAGLFNFGVNLLVAHMTGT
ncbi:MAG: rhomboid family intramembrane serine protease, partial [Bdellovibrionales bacterium]|nr:rhomboid family intramembrane serine protease [Bdellovibrionales bacterium]